MSRHRRPPRRRAHAVCIVRALAAAVLLAGLAAWPAPAAADEDEAGPQRASRTAEQDAADQEAGQLVNRAVAQNDRDDSYLHRLSFSVRRAHGDAVTATNLALAYASCRRCRTVAIAFQVVLVVPGRADGDPRPLQVTGVNRSAAVNEQCVACDTLARAYQFVVVDDGSGRLSEDARRELARMRRELAGLLRAGAPDDVISGRLADLAVQVQALLAARPDTHSLRERADGQRSGEDHQAHGRRDLGDGAEDVAGDATQPAADMAA